MALVPPAPDGASSEPTIGIKIKTLDGGNGFTLDVAANISVRDLKAKLQSQTGLVPTMQRIIFRGKMLQENALLSDYDVEDGHALHLVARFVNCVAKNCHIYFGKHACVQTRDSAVADSRSQTSLTRCGTPTNPATCLVGSGKKLPNNHTPRAGGFVTY